MWSIDAFMDLAVGDGSAAGTWLARTGFSLACLIKIAIESKRDYSGYYEPTTYLYFKVRARHLKHRQRMPTKLHYRVFLAARLLFSTALLLGTAPRFAALGLAFCFAFEGFIHFKFHVNFFTLLACCFVFSPDMPTLWDPMVKILTGDPQSALDIVRSAHGSRFCQSAVALTLGALYIGGARRKLNAPFVSGMVVISILRFTLAEAPRRHHFDGWYPRPFQAWTARIQPGDKIVKAAMTSVIGLEAVLPLMLLVPGAWPYALGIGVLMHAAFTFMFPGTLTAFSVATVSAYFCFMPV
ncbi:hypothetical protein [Kitasatospora purpeofusca]|uniref:hypothetical protein n=1 Tax=Kitasatospora purpeofusca TaxID=67352 RepID=UPI002E110060